MAFMTHGVLAMRTVDGRHLRTHSSHRAIPGLWARSHRDQFTVHTARVASVRYAFLCCTLWLVVRTICSPFSSPRLHHNGADDANPACCALLCTSPPRGGLPPHTTVADSSAPRLSPRRASISASATPPSQHPPRLHLSGPSYPGSRNRQSRQSPRSCGRSHASSRTPPGCVRSGGARAPADLRWRRHACRGAN